MENGESNNFLVEGQCYQVSDGPMINLLFFYSFGHKRPFLCVEDFTRSVLGGFLPISGENADSIPFGPSMPRCNISDLRLDEAFATLDPSIIREVICAKFHGRGYEIGAGARPTCVPMHSQVEYIDKFTFEEVKFSSLLNNPPDRLVNVSRYEEMGDLKTIANLSADFFIACHVIEHTSNVIKAIEEVMSKIRKGGFLFLVVPDKRYTFDTDRSTTDLEHFVSEYISGYEHNLEHYLDYARRAMRVENWVTTGKANFESGADAHMHTFTPDSMRELLDFVLQSGIVSRFDVFETGLEFSEFYAVLEK